MSRIIAENVHKRFKDNQVLRGFSFCCENEIVFIAGRNGAGKTTFIRLALGMERPEEGTIELDRGGEAAKEDVGVVFDTPFLYHQMTCKDNIEIFATGHLKDRAYVKEVLESLNIDDRMLRKKVGKCSFGQQHRVSVAIALIRRPRFLFLDELTVGLDPLSWELVRKSILRNKTERQGCTVITGQDYFELGGLADKLLVLDGGAAQYYGTVAGLIERYPKEIVLRTDNLPLPDKLRSYLVASELDADGYMVYRFKVEKDEQKILKLIQQNVTIIKQLTTKESTLKDAVYAIIKRERSEADA